MKPLLKPAALMALALAYASPALADAVNDQLERGIYYAQLSASSLDLAGKVTARKEKCQWARQSRGELSQGLSYYEGAQRLARNDPKWSPAQRVKLDELVNETRESLQQTDDLIKKLC
jgi:hypothetical protein